MIIIPQNHLSTNFFLFALTKKVSPEINNSKGNINDETPNITYIKKWLINAPNLLATFIVSDVLSKKLFNSDWSTLQVLKYETNDEKIIIESKTRKTPNIICWVLENEKNFFNLLLTLAIRGI